MSNAKHYIWLVGFTALAYWQIAQINHWPQAIQSLLQYAPYGLAALGIFISVFLNRIQPIFLLLTLAVLNFSMGYFLPSGTAKSDVLTTTVYYPLLASFLPLNILLWSLVPERGVLSKPYTILLSTLFVMQAAGFYWLMDNLPMQFILKLAQPIQAIPVNIPMIPLLITLLVWVLLVMRNAFLTQTKVLDKTVIFVLILMAYGLNQYASFGVLAWLSLMSVTLIILSQVFDSHQIAHTDQLTGMSGRRALFERFTGLGRKYAIAMMDIDHFKSFNDRYGHDIGDKALKLVASQLARIPVGYPYRYGGEEFTIVFPGKTAQQVESVLNDVRKQIESLPLDVVEKGEKKQTQVTVSFGVADKLKQHNQPEDVMKSADEALYQAKKSGRNCVVVFNDGSDTTMRKLPRPKATPPKTAKAK